MGVNVYGGGEGGVGAVVMLTGTEDKMEHNKLPDSMQRVHTPRPDRLTSPTQCFKEETLKGV